MGGRARGKGEGATSGWSKGPKPKASPKHRGLPFFVPVRCGQKNPRSLFARRRKREGGAGAAALLTAVASLLLSPLSSVPALRSATASIASRAPIHPHVSKKRAAPFLEPASARATHGDVPPAVERPAPGAGAALLVASPRVRPQQPVPPSGPAPAPAAAATAAAGRPAAGRCDEWLRSRPHERRRPPAAHPDPLGQRGFHPRRRHGHEPDHAVHLKRARPGRGLGGG